MAKRLAFIIPTLNEEHTLPYKLKQFERLNIPHEVIVADGGSTDNTIAIAKAFGAKFVINAGKQTIGSNRNIGAGVATAPILVFCDADTVFRDITTFCARIFEEFADKEVVAAMPQISVFPEQRIGSDKVFHYMYNNAIRLSFKTAMPFGSGQCQIVRRDAFIKSGGYPPDQVHGEDSILFRKLRKFGKLVYLTDCTILESPRRYRHYGYLKFITISTASLVGQSIIGRNVLKEWKRVG
ncbi:MAG: glycosyltransferase involved in cell wall biosynthesis [Limisphaerales bacterium]|jgi:glycosyltransferase involved in cell wall biosynthesis